MPTIQVLRNTLLNALAIEIQADPGVLQRNLGASNYALMDRTCRRLRGNDPGWHLLGKPAQGAHYTPADWRPLSVLYRGVTTVLDGVSHDVLMYTGGITPESGDGGPYPFGVQFDCLSAANHTNTPINDDAGVNGSAIPPDDYRPSNPPVRPGQWLEGTGTQPPPTGGVPPFPPRDEVLNFGLTLNLHYGSKGAGVNGTLGAPVQVASDARYLNFEGEVVWLPEYLRRRQLGETHQQATNNVLADVDAAWPK